MTKPKLQTQEKYSGDFHLAKILIQILAPDILKRNDNASGIVMP